MATLPCCEREEATTKFCFRCIELVCKESSNFGKCPRCNGPIEIQEDGRSIAIGQGCLRCHMCGHKKNISCFNSPTRGICSICEVGVNNPLRYECNRCHRVQRIPHPMYRYQPRPTEFGEASWACHRGCNDYTYWRILPADVLLVPADDAPEGWAADLQEQQLERIREIRRQEMQGYSFPSCSIM